MRLAGGMRLMSERRALSCLVAGGMLADENGRVWAYAAADGRSLKRGVLPRHILLRLQRNGQVRPMPGEYGRYLLWRTDVPDRLSRAAPPCPPVGQGPAPSLLEVALSAVTEETRPRLGAAAGRLRDDLVQAASVLSQGQGAVAALEAIEHRLGTETLRDLEAMLIDRDSVFVNAWRHRTTQSDVSRRAATALTRLGEHYALMTA